MWTHPNAVVLITYSIGTGRVNTNTPRHLILKVIRAREVWHATLLLELHWYLDLFLNPVLSSSVWKWRCSSSSQGCKGQPSHSKGELVNCAFQENLSSRDTVLFVILSYSSHLQRKVLYMGYCAVIFLNFQFFKWRNLSNEYIVDRVQLQGAETLAMDMH